MTSPTGSSSPTPSSPPRHLPQNSNILTALTPVPPSPTSPPLLLSPHAPTPALSGPLTALSCTYLAAYETASRMGLGVPLRVEVKTADGGVVVQSGIREEGEGEVVLVGSAVGREEAGVRVAGWGVERVGQKVVERRRV